MRARNIKPGYFNNEELAECDPLARILFAGLWCLADREGRLEDRPKRIKRDVLGYDDCDVDTLLGQLHDARLIVRYTVAGQHYIQVTNFDKHQRPHANEQDSVIPPMADVVATSVVPTSHQGSKSAQPRELPLRPESLLSDTGISESLTTETPLAEQSAQARMRPAPKPAKVLEHNPIWDALAATCGKPETRNERSDFGLTVSQLREVDATPDQIAGFPLWWRAEHPNATMTHRCYRDHWGRYINAPPKPPPQISDLKNGRIKAALTTDLSDITAKHEAERAERNSLSGQVDYPRLSATTRRL